MNRRSLLSLMLFAGAQAALPRRGRGAPVSPGSFWIHVQAEGGWDQALLCDPKPALRPPLPAADRAVRRAGGVSYLSLCDFGGPSELGFFGRYHDRMLVVNGIDTATNNHDIGTRYSSSGSTNERTPCFAAQVAAVYGQAQPLSFVDCGGYDETGELVPPTRLQLGGTEALRGLVQPNADGAELFLPAGTADLVAEAHRRRSERLRAALRLPGQRQALDRLMAVRAAQKDLATLQIPTGADDQAKLIRIGLDAYAGGLASSMNLSVRGFDSHSANEATQRDRLRELFNTVSLIIDQAEARSLPAVILMTSDFGRSPYYTNDGTDHWPVSSAIIVATRAAKARGLRLPLDQTIGGTSDGAVAQALRAQRVNPRTLQADPAGIIMTPGHLMRGLRRAAGVADADALRRFPITVEQDLSIG